MVIFIILFFFGFVFGPPRLILATNEKMEKISDKAF